MKDKSDYTPVSEETIHLDKPWSASNLKFRTDYKPFWKQLALFMAVTVVAGIGISLGDHFNVWGFAPDEKGHSLFGFLLAAYVFVSTSALIRYPFQLHEDASKLNYQDALAYYRYEIMPIVQRLVPKREWDAFTPERAFRLLEDGSYNMACRIKRTDRFNHYDFTLDGSTLTFVHRIEEDGSDWAGTADPEKRRRKLEALKLV